MCNNKDWYDIYKESDNYIQPSINTKLNIKCQQQKGISSASQNTRQLDIEYGHFCYYCGKEMKVDKVEEFPKCDIQAQYNAEYKALNRKYGVEG